MVSKEIQKYMASIGKKGGKSATGEKKDRRVTSGDPDFYKKLAKVRIEKARANDAEN